MFKENTKNLINSKIFWLFFIVGLFLILVPGFYFLDPNAIIGNMGKHILIIESITTVLIAIFFAIFLGATIHKMYTFRTKNMKVSGFLGAILGVLVSGCPACSITLISYIGLTFGGMTLSQMLYNLPLHGLELKIISLLLLVYAVYTTIKNLNHCSIKIKKVNK